jgi:hypothetical protein
MATHYKKEKSGQESQKKWMQQIKESEDQVWRIREEFDLCKTSKIHEMAEKDELIAGLRAKDSEVQKEMQKYRTDILEFIKDIDGLEKGKNFLENVI